MKSLSGKHAVVCGASKGIGQASAMELARLGASVTVVARSEAALQEVAASLEASGDQTHRVLVADYANRPGLTSTINVSFGRLFRPPKAASPGGRRTSGGKSDSGGD